MNTAKKERAKREDWINAALWLLAEEGIDAITIDRLCEILGLTKGSFYWHFKKRQDLLTSMADYWSNSAELFEQLNHSGLDDWEQINKIAQKMNSQGYGNIDKAMRLWGETCEETRQAVKKTDAEALSFVSKKLRNLGLKSADAKLVAEMIVACGIGLTAIEPSLSAKKLKQFEQKWLSLIESLKA